MQLDCAYCHTIITLFALVRGGSGFAVGCGDTYLLEQATNTIDNCLADITIGKIVERMVVTTDNLLFACLLACSIIFDSEAHHVYTHVGW